MKTFAFVALAGVAASVSAQDLVVCVDDLDGDGRWIVTAQFNGTIPAGNTGIGTIWSDTSFVIGGDGSNISFVPGSDNPAYTSGLFGGPVLVEGANASFVGLMAASPIGSPDPSNPLSVVDFEYFGDPRDLTVSLTGQNTALFVGNPNEPFGTIRTYLDVFNNPGQFTFDVVIKIPAPASAALLGLGGLAAARRRR